MTEPRKVRLALIGAGGMGNSHLRDIANGRVPSVELVAVCDSDAAQADKAAAEYGVPAHYSHTDLLAQAAGLALDAVLIATPHYDHTPIAIDTLGQGIHVLCEKPLAVHVKDGRKMIAAYEDAVEKFPGLKFGIMFQQRTHAYWRKIKAMIDGGELGKLVRATWLITDWFRPQCYYDGGGWRATWRGEGGGVLLNQCPHNLDLYQWFFGTPSRVAGFAHIGKYHNIEVEDEVTGYFEHANGMVGHFVTTTAESPGTNRLEIVGELGKLICEQGELAFWRNDRSMIEYITTATQAFTHVVSAPEAVELPDSPPFAHAAVTEAFARAVLDDEPLVAFAPEGLNGLAIGNAIMLSSFLGRPVELPFDEDAYEARLKELAANSRFQKVVRKVEADMDQSFH
ncbi:MAG: Gfo/Idh/MocA family protein [Chloroflexota bacterium]